MIKSSLKNSRGITMMELMIAVGIVGIVSVIAMQFLNDQSRQNRKLEEAIEYKIDTLLSDKVILKDFRNAMPSINQLRILDQNGVNFFDLEPDQGGALNCPGCYKFRALTLGHASGAPKKFYLLLANPTKGDSVFTDPVIAYDIGAPSATDPNAPASITFVGLNRVPSGSSVGYLTSRNPLLSANDLVFVDSSGTMKVTPNNPVNRSAAWLGFLTAPGDIVVNPAIPDGIFTSRIYTKDPTNGAEIITTPANFDQFLQSLPPNGASGSSVRIMGVKLVKYELKCVAADATDCSLERSEWSNTGFINQRDILNHIKGVTFRRDSISNTITTVSYDQYKKN
jgi:Prokaryotic N-terminal methylation motif